MTTDGPSTSVVMRDKASRLNSPGVPTHACGPIQFPFPIRHGPRLTAYGRIVFPVPMTTSPSMAGVGWMLLPSIIMCGVRVRQDRHVRSDEIGERMPDVDVVILTWN